MNDDKPCHCNCYNNPYYWTIRAACLLLATTFCLRSFICRVQLLLLISFGQMLFSLLLLRTTTPDSVDRLMCFDFVESLLQSHLIDPFPFSFYTQKKEQVKTNQSSSIKSLFFSFCANEKKIMQIITAKGVID